MTLIINPGSRIGEPGSGWTNTVEVARTEAERWLAGMHSDGLVDVELLDGETEREGRSIFTFRHKVTGTRVELETPGISNLAAYQKDNLLAPYPRVYWNGSSCSNPELEHFAAPGFTAIRTFKPEPEEG